MVVNRASMKRKYILIPLLSAAVALTACKDKPSTVTPDSTGGTSDQTEQSAQPAAPKPDPIKATSTPEARAAKLGFAKNLPKDIAYFGALYNGRKAFDQLLETEMGEFILQRLADEEMSIDDLMGNDDFSNQIATYSEEYFTAYGAGSGEAIDTALKLYETLAYYGARTGVFAGDGFVRDGDDFEPDFTKIVIDGPLKGAPKDIIKLLAAFDMPAFYQGSKISDKEMRESVVAQMEEGIGMLANMEGMAESITIKRGETEFTGYKILGERMAAEIDDDAVEQMKEFIDIADIEAFKKALATKTLVVVTGVMDDYVILFVGKTGEDLVFVDQAADSVCANEKMVFIDQYLDKEILTAGYYDSSIMKSSGNIEAIAYRMIGSLAKGLKDGLGDASSLGDTQDLEVLLDSLEKQGGKLASLFSATDAGFIAYLEEGVKVEVYGGTNVPSLDLTQTHTLSPLAAGDGTLLFANWVNDKDYNEKVLEYIDTLGETSYLVAKRISALDIDDRDFEQFKEGLDEFDRSFRKDALEVWKALRVDLTSGLGSEAALVIDVNGALPKVPGVPASLLKEGKMPRIGYVSTVDDRSKIQASWKRINTSAESILKTVSKMAGKEIPMQDMMSSEKDGLTTWWTSIPFTGNDFLPCVSVSDELFLASTSKTFSEGLAAQVKKGGGESRKGAWLHVDFKVLNQYANQWLELVSKNAEDAFPSESAREDFEKNKPMIKGALKAFGSIEEMTLHTRNEGGRTRISFQLKAK